MNPDNDWYGHKRVLADYCNLVKPKAIFGYIPHGWYFNVPEGAGARRFTSAPYFAWNARHTQQLAERGIQNVRCIGAPFVYLYEQLFPKGASNGQGTLLFPSHSAEGFSPDNHVESLAANIEENFPPPYAVSIFYQDLNGRESQFLQSRGWRIVTFGRRSDDNFLSMQIKEIAAHSHIVGNFPQTALWYGALMRRTTWVLGQPPSVLGVGPGSDESRVSFSFSNTYSSVMKDYPNLFTTGIRDDEAFDIAAHELGYNHRLDPESLREILGWASVTRSSIAKIVGLAVDLKSGGRVRSGQVLRD